MNSSKKITIYLADGLPGGIREVKIDQWSGRGICGPRNRLAEIIGKYPELDRCCLYFLAGESDDGGLTNVYVGEADGFKSRIKDHDYKKEWWQSVVVFFSQDGSLTKAGIQYLESVCIERLKKAGRCALKNSNQPLLPSIPAEDVAGLEYFYDQVALTLPLLGYDIFEPRQQGAVLANSQAEIFCEGRDASAVGVLLNDGKVKVLKGSKAKRENAPAFEKHHYNKLKDQLVRIGKLAPDGRQLVFVDDRILDSPSAAAAVILARSAAGPSEWEDKDGKTLKDIWAEQVT
ncbi:MAG: GIY-YIG nuclease family protein [Candidatus Acidiferrum sp.]|jgi:hypothetical protein